MKIFAVSQGEFRDMISRYLTTPDAAFPLLQSHWWGQFKSRFGWMPLYFSVDDKPMLVLQRKIWRKQRIWYIPWGPAWFQNIQGERLALEGIASVSKELVAASAGSRILPVCIRYDLPGYKEEKTELDQTETEKLPDRVHLPDQIIQVPSTVLLNLKQDWQAILDGMKKKTRYNIRLAQKKGVQVRVGSLADLDSWYEIYQETAKRDSIAIHSKEYYAQFMQISQAEDEQNRADSFPHVELLLAEHEGDLLGGIITVHYAGLATYMYGAGSNVKRNLMASYVLQAEAIQRAQAAGCHTYDFLGIPESDDPADPMHGLYRFKTGFGGTIVHRMGLADVSLRKWKYRAFSAAERIRSWYYRTWRKR